MRALFGGYRMGPITWPAEIGLIRDALPGGGHGIYASLLDANRRILKAHNLIGDDFVGPSDTASDDWRKRSDLLREYTPLPLVRTRAGLRFYDGAPNDASGNRDELFFEKHSYL